VTYCVICWCALKPKYKVFYYLILTEDQYGDVQLDPESYSFYWVASKWFKQAKGKPAQDNRELLDFVLEWVIL
jgi:hypothetical protein